MKHSAFNIVPEVNSKFCIRSNWHPHGPRKLACWNHNWRQCLSLPLVSGVLFTLNSFYKAK